MTKKNQAKKKLIQFERYIHGGLGGVVRIGKWFKLVFTIGSRDKGSSITECYVFQITRTDQNLKHFWWQVKLLGYDLINCSLTLYGSFMLTNHTTEKQK